MKKEPCNNCTMRHYKCHASCKSYIQYTKQRKEINDKRRMDNFADGKSGRVVGKHRWS